MMPEFAILKAVVDISIDSPTINRDRTIVVAKLFDEGDESEAPSAAAEAQATPS